MGNGLPEIAPEERTPLVNRLLEIIQQQADENQRLIDEIAILKRLNARPKIKPSRLEDDKGQATNQQENQGEKRPGSAKRSKTAELKVTDEVVLAVLDAPPGSTVKGYEEIIVQDLEIKSKVTRYRRQRMQLPDGRTVLAPLPAGVQGHFGAELIAYILMQYHHNGVTQPLLLEELWERGIDISAGQLSRILTENKEAFHQEKEELLPAGLESSSYINVDDTSARHQGKNGFCLHIGNELFCYFESTDSKSRLNFLEILRRPHTDYVINDTAVAYWKRQELAAAWIDKLGRGPQEFADQAAWQARLAELGISGERHVRIASEGALLGSLIAHGVSPELAVMSDGALQFVVLLHILCWIHMERLLAKMIPISERHREAIEKIRDLIWELYRDLKAYRAKPDPARSPELQARFDALVNQPTDFTTVNHVLKQMRERKAELLAVLERPELPLHNNTAESHLREYVKKRKISGGTRSNAGRRCRDTFTSLKKTCRCLGLSFWQYLVDRIKGLGQIPRLPDLIRQRAAENQAPDATAVPACPPELARRTGEGPPSRHDAGIPRAPGVLRTYERASSPTTSFSVANSLSYTARGQD